MKPMKVRFREELQKIKSMQGREKRQYIWDYYKFHIIGTIIGVLMLGSLINDTIINPPPSSALTIAWMAGFELDERLNALEDVLHPIVVGDTDRERIMIIPFHIVGEPQNDMAQMQRFQAMLAAREIDIVIGHYEHVIDEEMDIDVRRLGLAPAWGFSDLRPILVEAGVTADAFIFCYDEEYGVPFAFATPLEGSALFTALEIPTEDRYLGVIVNTARHEQVVAAIHALWTGL